eukprot:1161215-Pelagomonas_calceolata.AAC.6
MHPEVNRAMYLKVGKYFASQELRQIKTVPAAISMARTNAVMRAINAANYNDFILDCFKFQYFSCHNSFTGSGSNGCKLLKKHTFVLVVNHLEDISPPHRFVDTEQRGSLGVEGLRDGFAALGVQLTDEDMCSDMLGTGPQANVSLSHHLVEVPSQ